VSSGVLGAHLARDPRVALPLLAVIGAVGLWRLWAFRLSVPRYIHVFATAAVLAGYYLTTLPDYPWRGSIVLEALTIFTPCLFVYGLYGFLAKAHQATPGRAPPN
jgi:hypothetical protein